MNIHMASKVRQGTGERPSRVLLLPGHLVPLPAHPAYARQP
jgi:hypothetical protein